MKLKYLVAVSLLALASMGAQAASTLAGSGVTLSDGNSATVTHVPGSFSDSWTLIVDETTGAANVSISFTDVEFILATLTFEIDGMSVSGNPAFSGSNDAWSFSGPLVNGSYNMMVNGIASGTAGGFYNAGFNAVPTAAPVPIPPAALLFGSALIGLAGLRRKKAAKELVEA